jgi:hypothetical protein
MSLAQPSYRVAAVDPSTEHEDWVIGQRCPRCPSLATPSNDDGYEIRIKVPVSIDPSYVLVIRLEKP